MAMPRRRDLSFKQLRVLFAVASRDSEYDVFPSPRRLLWSGSIGSGATWTPTSRRRKRAGRRRAIRARIKSGRARRAWWAPSRARAAPTAAMSCCRVSTRPASARAAGLSCTVASNAFISTPPRASSAPSPSPSALPRRTLATTAGSTNSALRSKRTLRLPLRPRLPRPRPRTPRVRTTPARPSRICLRSKAAASLFRSNHPSAATNSLRWCRPRVGEKRRFLGRLAGDALEVRVMVPQRLGHLHFLSGEQTDQLQGVHDGFALVVIVGDDKSRVRARGKLADALGPGLELFLAVEIVVTVVRGHRRVIAEPGVVPPAVQANVTHRPGGTPGGLERPANHGLVDIAEAHAVLLQQLVEALVAPGGVPHLDDERVIGKALEQSLQVLQVLRRVVERIRELQQHRAQFSGVA